MAQRPRCRAHHTRRDGHHGATARWGRASYMAESTPKLIPYPQRPMNLGKRPHITPLLLRSHLRNHHLEVDPMDI
jgi:hypothetical protein